MILKLSALPSARPPETTRVADCRSGRPVAAPERDTKRVCEGSATPRSDLLDRRVATELAAASNEATRTVATTGASAGTSTVRIALPA